MHERLEGTKRPYLLQEVGYWARDCSQQEAVGPSAHLMTIA